MCCIFKLSYNGHRSRVIGNVVWPTQLKHVRENNKRQKKTESAKKKADGCGNSVRQKIRKILRWSENKTRYQGGRMGGRGKG